MHRRESNPPQGPVLFLSLDRDWRLDRVPSGWLDRAGGPDDATNPSLLDFLTDAARRDILELIPRYHACGFCTDIPLQIVTSNGVIMDVLFSATAERDQHGEIVRSQAVISESRGRSQAVRALRESRDIFFRAFRSSGAILIISTVDTGRFIEVNEAFERIIGYRRDEVIGRHSSELKMWQDPQDRARYLRLLEEQGKVRDLEVRVRSKSGSGLAGMLSGELVELEGECCLLTTINDVTGHKRAAEEIEVLHTELASHALALEIANEELEAFSYTVSHDLRNPLTAISGYCQLLLYEDDCNTPEGRRLLNEILNGAVRMSELVSTMLDLSRLGNGELQKTPVDLSGLASCAAEDLRAGEPGRKAQIVVQPGLVANGDGPLLRVVLDNLIGNAWKYTAQRDEAQIEFGCTDIDGRAVYFVRDNGIGFDSSAGSQILFKAFHRQPGTQGFKGFGIGLATVKRIITRHGGSIWAEATPGTGACFYFRLE
jgi:PAS domain S-box-containing protein